MTEQLSAWPAESAVFRPVQYLGCKLRVLETLERVVDDVQPGGGRLLDLFSGTGVVAAHFARSRPVVAADIQEYARVLTGALLAAATPSARDIRGILDTAAAHARAHNGTGMAALAAHERRSLERAQAGAPDALCAVVEDGSIVRYQHEPATVGGRLATALRNAAAELPAEADAVLTRYYGGVYFSYRQALALDGLACAARRLPRPLRDVGLAAVMSTASALVSSVGSQFAQPVRLRARDGRPKTHALRTLIQRRRLPVRELFVRWLERYASLTRPLHEGLAVRADYVDVLKGPPNHVSVVYADPPYTRDHYSRYYHVLETIALGDDPGISLMRSGATTRISRGLYRVERHQSPFCIKSQAPGAFRALVAGARELDAPLVLSYSPHGEGSASRPRLMAVADIVELARDSYGDVKVVPVGSFAHSKLNAARLNSATVYDAELLIVCRP
jgi:adenine-specific DNA-methyltransferase